MSDSWRKYGEAAEKGPMSLLWKVLGFVFIALILIGIVGFVLGFIGNTGKMINQEFSPEVMLQKYEYYKDVAAQLDAKSANINVYENELKDMANGYGNISIKDWARDDREFYRQRTTEISGMKASYNKLAADYNAAMAKFNWAFANVGTLPKGADKVLPREYRTYLTD